ncbi:GlyGly-CTERM sorting domain-containing protein [Propionimicrobium lymphophilum]|nr:GlyGly-CTERM sorting domain-containing protein [Propionimicrobium lymphophilum]
MIASAEAGFAAVGFAALFIAGGIALLRRKK